MTKNLLFISCLVANISISLAQTPANGNLENWATTPPATYENPIGWATSNDIVGGFGLANVTKVTTPVQSGTYAAKLESIDVFGLSTAPGLIGIVTIDPLDQSLTPGIAFTSRPDSVTGFYQYAPISGDNFLVYGLLTKWNGTSRDTIGTAEFTSGSTVSSYARFAAAFNYANATVPDSLTLIISSSAVCLNLLRPQNQGSHNMRTFELPAMGGLMLTCRTEEQQEFFPENESCFMYADVGELKAKIEYINGKNGPKLKTINKKKKKKSR
jgi:hypothetical protein